MTANEMKLWLVERTSPAWYDEYWGMVVRASDEANARRLAGECSMSLGSTIDVRWLDAAFAFCTELTADGEEAVILSDFNAG